MNVLKNITIKNTPVS